jgi:hypothetical protein
MDRQPPSAWVRRDNEHGVDGRRDRPKPGRPCGLDEGRQAALRALILEGPAPARDGLSAWRRRDLGDLAEVRLGRRLPAPAAGSGSGSKSLPEHLAAVAAAPPEAERVELWFADG